MAGRAGSEEIVLYKERPVPIDNAVFWFPIELGPRDQGADSYARFITRGALRQIANHVAATEDPDEPGQLGFLLGDLFRCPETSARYAIIDSALPSSERVREDRTTAALPSAWKALQDLPRGDRGHVLGWYHVHTRGDLKLSGSDASAHNRFFTQPWQTAIVLEPSERGARGIVCRPDRGWPNRTALMPFYEISDPAKDREEAEVPFTWQGYRHRATRSQSDEPPGRLPSHGAPRSRGERSTKVVLPHELDRALEEEDGRRRRGASGRIGRVLRLAVLLIVGAGAIAWWQGWLPWDSDGRIAGPETPGVTTVPAESPGGADPEAATGGANGDPAASADAADGAAGPLSRLDRLAQELERSISGYRERARLYGNDQMTCADLGRGLVGVEDAWTAYNSRGRSAVSELDSERAERDDRLYEQVQSVERHYAGTACPRP